MQTKFHARERERLRWNCMDVFWLWQAERITDHRMRCVSKRNRRGGLIDGLERKSCARSGRTNNFRFEIKINKIGKWVISRCVSGVLWPEALPYRIETIYLLCFFCRQAFALDGIVLEFIQMITVETRVTHAGDVTAIAVDTSTWWHGVHADRNQSSANW